MATEVWQVTRGLSGQPDDGPADGSHAVYAISPEFFEQHVRVRRKAADACAQRLREGRKVRRGRWKVGTAKITKVTLHVSSGFLIVAFGPLARLRLDPASEEEAAVARELFESLAQIIPNSGERRRSVSNRLDPQNLIPMLLGVILGSVNITFDGRTQPTIALVLAGVVCSLAVARHRTGSRVIRSFVRARQASTLGTIQP